MGNCCGENIGLKIRNAPGVFNIQNEYGFRTGDIISVTTERGKEVAEVLASCSCELSEIGKENSFLKKIHTHLTEEERENIEKFRDEEKSALETFREKVEKHELPMKVIEVYFMLDRSRIMFYYYAENKVDFRKLVRELAGIYRTRIEMRQVGIRDEAKIRGGLGPCGLVTCCKRFLYDFESISMKMAKDQEIMLNPSKISGICGRLMCCLKYEQHTYTEFREGLPTVGTYVTVNNKAGKVTNINVLKKTFTVEFDEGEFAEYTADYLKKNRNMFKFNFAEKDNELQKTGDSSEKNRTDSR